MLILVDVFILRILLNIDSKNSNTMLKLDVRSDVNKNMHGFKIVSNGSLLAG